MRFISSVTSSYRRPIKRLIEYTVFSGFVTAWRFATCPTRRSPPLVIATTEGVVRAPSWLGITTGSPPCMTATTELVVPRSIPIILLILLILSGYCFRGCWFQEPVYITGPPAKRKITGRAEVHGVLLHPNRRVVYNLSVSLSSFLVICVNAY